MRRTHSHDPTFLLRVVGQGVAKPIKSSLVLNLIFIGTILNFWKSMKTFLMWKRVSVIREFKQIATATSTTAAGSKKAPK